MTPSRAIYWRCFHCGDAFTKAQWRWAKEHFGADQDETPVCLMRVPGEGSLLSALRQAQDELYKYRSEDTSMARAMFSMSSDHGQALQRAEEKGYEKALNDIEAGKVEADHAVRIIEALSPLVRAR